MYFRPSRIIDNVNSSRRDLDGLRAIAVIPVIFYHASLRMYCSDGYVGVDIFFVISGYLITSLILNERQEENFSLINFYERRCRRILPALFLILFLSSFCAYYLMSPEQLKEFGETLLSIMFFGSNIYFWWKDDGYFSQLSDLNPLVHTWSLAVEEQFYLIFPIVCYLLHRKKIHLTIVLISVSGMSLVLSQMRRQYASKEHRSISNVLSTSSSIVLFADRTHLGIIARFFGGNLFANEQFKRVNPCEYQTDFVMNSEKR